MYCTATFASVIGLVALILTLSLNVQAQTGPPVFRSPADAGRTDHGYLFRVRVERLSSESPSSYEVVAVPRKYGTTGRRSFYVNETSPIVAADRKGAAANVGDDPLDP
jgi:hypothetical protein